MSEWMSPTRHTLRHFRDESVAAISCTVRHTTDNRKYIKTQVKPKPTTDIHCVQKRDQNVIRNISHKTPATLIWYTVSWTNLLQKDVNVFHLTWIMSLHYLVKPAMLIAHVLPLSCYWKKLHNLTHLNCVLQLCQISIQLINEHVENIAIEGAQNTHHCSGAINDVTDEWRLKWQHDPAWLTLFSVAVSVHLDQWRVFCTASLPILATCCNQLDSNLANSMAARVRWAFQVSQGSVETLFRWDEKQL